MFIISSGPQKYHIIALTDMGLSEGLLNTRNVIQKHCHQLTNKFKTCINLISNICI